MSVNQAQGKEQPGRHVTCEISNLRVSSYGLRVAIGKGQVADVFSTSLWVRSRKEKHR